MSEAAGLYYNFGNIDFIQSTDEPDGNQGTYIEINNNDVKTGAEVNKGTGLFLTSKAENVRIITLTEINEKMGNIDKPFLAIYFSPEQDRDGLFELSKYNFAYARGDYWIASPSVDDNKSVALMRYGGSSVNHSGNYGVRPVVKIRGDHIRFNLSEDGTYYEMTGTD